MGAYFTWNRRKISFGILTLLVICICVPIARKSTAQERTRQDYLTAKLRQDVNRLKQDAARQPTNEKNIVERGLILWDWVNAYSLTGGPVPANATQELAPVFQLKDGGDAGARSSAARQFPKAVDELIYEFGIKDEKPRAIPTLRLDRAGPFQASSWQTIRQTLTCGEMPMPAGSTLMFGRMLMSDGGLVQIQDAAADNYVSIRSSNPGVRFAKTEVSYAGMHGGFRGAVPNAAYRIEVGSLQPGDTVTLTYGDTSGGSHGFQMPSFSNDKFLLPVYVSFKADGPLLTPAWPPIRLEGNAVAKVKAFAPSIVRPGEKFELAVRSEDERWNRATGPVPAYAVTLNGQAVRTIPAGAEGLVVLKDVAIERPGTYRFQILSADGKIAGESNPIWVEADPKYRIYWGETHAHSGLSEGMGSIDGFYRWGRDDARLDFLGLSEHDIWTDAGEWRSMQDAVRRYTDPGRYIAYLAYEWTGTRLVGGHHNVFFRTPQHNRAPVQMAYTLSRLYYQLRAGNNTNDVLIIPHAHQAGDWRRNDPDMERLVEIMSMHGTFEWFGNYYLKNGFDVGFVAASDDHRTRPGYSGTMRSGSLQQFGGLVAVKAKEKSVNGIFDALRDRYTYAVTSAERILLDVDLNGERVGRRIPYSTDRRIHARFSGTGPLDRVDLVKNGDVIFSRRFATAPLRPRSRVHIGFRSSSEAFIRDNPRGYRLWKGTLLVDGARLLSVEPYFDNRYTEFARQDAQSPNKISFSTDTRGGIDALMLELDDVTPSTKITINLEASTEHDVAPVQVRPNARIPAASLVFPFSELKEGLLVRDSAVGKHADAITLQLADPDAPRDGELDFVDRTPPGQGDYYYMRVTQLNGAHAWSSPVWVGGESSR
jgi:hypothetical protein